MRKKIITLIPVILFLIIAGCAKNNEQPAKESNEVWIKNGHFVPSEKEITPGTTITWINKTDSVQTVTSGVPGFILFDSGELKPGESFTFTFNDVGPVQYYSNSNPDSLTGLITVVPEEVQSNQ